MGRDEIALALTGSRGSAQARLGHALRLDGVLRPRDLLEAGDLDWSRARLICDRTEHLDGAVAAAVQERVLGRAPSRTCAQLNAALRRAILAVDPDGAAARTARRRTTGDHRDRAAHHVGRGG